MKRGRELRCDTAVILGSGLSASVTSLPLEPVADYSEIECLHVPSVEGHPGKLAYLEGEDGSGVFLFMGRSHLYEGISPGYAGGAVRAAAAMGCSNVLITNAAGSLRSDIPAGSWFAAESIISFPLPRRNSGGCSGRGFVPGISKSFRRTVLLAALASGIRVYGGTLMYNTGPCYETPAEARAARRIGADAVTMSVLPELSAADELGLDAAVLSFLTNHTPNVSERGALHTEVIERCGGRSTELCSLLRNLLTGVSDGGGEGGSIR